MAMQVSMATHRSAATIVSRKVDLAGASRRGREAGPRHHQDRPATSPSSPPRSTWPSQHPRSSPQTTDPGSSPTEPGPGVVLFDRAKSYVGPEVDHGGCV